MRAVRVGLGWLLRLGAGALLLALLGLAWLRYDAHRDRAAYFAERQGSLQKVERLPMPAPAGLHTETLRLTATSGLAFDARLLRPERAATALPVLVLLGGHRTGADAVELFAELDDFAVLALDYPYDGPLRTRTLWTTLNALPAIRQAFLDAAPALSLAVDWLQTQDWVDARRIVLAGVSLGVPFAATAAARDERFSALMLVHGAADNGAWVRHNLARRIDLGPLLAPASTLGNWLVYGPLHDTAAHVAEVAPRPVIVVGAREDERTPRAQTEALYAAAGEPRALLWTEGRHVQPGRGDIVDELLRIAGAEMRRLAGPRND